MLPEAKRKTTPNILNVNDLTKLPASTVQQIQAWLTERINGYAAHCKELSTAKDRFAVSEDGTQLRVTAKYLLQLRVVDVAQVYAVLVTILSYPEGALAYPTFCPGFGLLIALLERRCDLCDLQATPAYTSQDKSQHFTASPTLLLWLYMKQPPRIAVRMGRSRNFRGQ